MLTWLFDLYLSNFIPEGPSAYIRTIYGYYGLDDVELLEVDKAKNHVSSRILLLNR